MTAKQAKKQEPKLHVIQKMIGSDTYMVLADSSTHLEDEFANLYYSASEQSRVILMPPFEPKQLASLVTKNNILSQCIDAMEVNIDGTGHDFIAIDDDTEADATEVQLLKDFFNEPYPGVSFITMRRKLRRDLESVGYAALEVLRTMAGELVCLRNLETSNLRYLKLDEAVQVQKTVMRAGKELTLTVLERERRYVQRLGNRYYYYREFGTSRHCHKDTGKWEDDNHKIEVKDRATELIMFEVNQDISGPYGVPRWINQMPSVIGSRKAEEQNLEYFDAGGLPPAIIFVQGGMLAQSTSDQLKNYLTGANKSRNRAVVVEAMSSSGSLESAGSVQVKVERFGAEKANDSMYQQYDKNAEEHVRVGFRLPPLFLGKAADYNYATAVVAYMVAEEQVFQPERAEFDAKLNRTVLKALGIKTLQYKSKGITLKNVDAVLKALEIAKDIVDGDDFIDELNQVVNTSLKYKEPPEPPKPGPGQQFNPQTGEVEATPQQAAPDASKAAAVPNSGTATPKDGITKSATELVELAHRYAGARGWITTKSELDASAQTVLATEVAALTPNDRRAFNQIIAGHVFKDDDVDLVNLTECAHAH
jgi:PBSX family phage portal protein